MTLRGCGSPSQRSMDVVRGPFRHVRGPSGSGLVQALSDVCEGLANLGVVLGRDGKHLRLMCRVFRNDHERGRTLTFDIELDSPQPVDLDIKRDAFLVSDGDPFVGNQDRRGFRGDVGANSLA